MQGVERIVLIALIAAILAVVLKTMMMLFALNGMGADAFETAVLVTGRAGGAV